MHSIADSNIPLFLLRRYDLYRLIPSRYADDQDSVLIEISDNPAHLKDLFDLDNATNQRLSAELGLASDIGVDELVFGIPNFRIINAAYTYPNPNGSRFNGPNRGTWYCAFEQETALAEVIFHKTVEYAEINYFYDTVSYQLYLSNFSAAFHDLRAFEEKEKYLSPQSYQESQLLASQLLESGSMGLIFPSVRAPGGTNLVCFRPALVNDVRKASKLRLEWSGDVIPSVQTVS